MTIYSCDIEANGLLDTVDKIHCTSFKGFGEKPRTVTDDSFWGTLWLDDGDTLIFHNGFGYDLPVLEKLGVISGYKLAATNGSTTVSLSDGTVKHIQLIDTLALSREYWPDMPLPRGCPATVYNPVTGKQDMIGAHSLLAWAYRLNGTKPLIHDWNNQPIEVYVERCEADVVLTEAVFLYLCEKLGIEL